jgi:hypothetical protein
VVAVDQRMHSGVDTHRDSISRRFDTFSADVYSMGVIVWEMLARQQPFADIHQMAVMYKVGSEGLRLCPPAGCPPFWRGLMEACWRPAPTRPSFMHIAQQLRAVHKEMQAGGGSASFAAGESETAA